jgi:hypothetical protein
VQRTQPIRKLLVALATCSLAAVAFASPAGADAGNGNGADNGRGAEETRSADAIDHGSKPDSAGPADGNDTAASHQTEGTAGTNGSPTEPQPASNADYTGNGANTHGSYDSTRDGSPSANGSDTGEATGRPCAGCVGAADNKNPQGQYPNGSDHNAGYECDRNQGIGQTNPAHTGCTEADVWIAAAAAADADAASSAAAAADESTPLAPGTRRVCSADAAAHSNAACSSASNTVTPVCPTGSTMTDATATTCVAAAVSGICPSGTAMTTVASCAGVPTCPSGTTMASGSCVASASASASPACAVTGGEPMVGDTGCAENHVVAAGTSRSPSRARASCTPCPPAPRPS